MKKKKDLSGFYLLIKTIFLSLAFAGILYSIYYLNTQGLEKTAIGQLLNPKPIENKNQPEQQWAMCSKDLVALSYFDDKGKNSWKVLRTSEGWRLLYRQSSKDLDRDKFKKCSFQICQLKVVKTTTDQLINFDDSLRYTYLDSSQTILRLNSDKEILFYEGNIYKASKLIRFLKDFPQSDCH